MRFISWLSLVLLLVAATPALAANPTPAELFAIGKQEFKTKQFAKAYDSFQQAFLKDPGNLNYSFYMGRAAFEKGDYEEAIMAYDRILIADPNAARVKLELARCHLRLGSRELAKQYFKEVLATHPPEAVWKNIKRFLAAIAASERRNFLSGIFSVGVRHDDNVSVTTNENVLVTFPGVGIVPITISPKKGDWIYNTTTVINHVYKFLDTPWSWKTSVVNYNDFYNQDSDSDLDIAYFGLTTGPVRQTKRYLWQLQILANYVAKDYDSYLGAYGLGTTLTLPFDEKLFLNLGTTFLDNNFYQPADSNSPNLRLYGGPVLTLGKNRLGVTLAWETENAQNPSYNYDRFSAEARYDRLLPYDFAFFAAARYENTRYRHIFPLFSFLGKRSDDLQKYTIGASRTLWRSADKRRRLAAQVSYAYTKATSNIPLYEYDKHVIATTMTLAF